MDVAPAITVPETPPKGPRPPRPRLTPSERRAALEISTLEGAFATAHSALSGNGVDPNVFSYGYALLLGASNAWLGVLSALPQIAKSGQVLAAYALQHVRSRRSFVIATCRVARNLVLVFPLLPFLLGREAALPAFIALYGLSSFVYGFAGNAWMSWMSDIVPSALRGRYFSRRSNLCNLVGLVVGMAGAAALDAYAGGGIGASATSDERRLLGFAVVFALAAALGGISTGLLRRQAEPERPPEADSVPGGPLPLAAFVQVPFRDAEFRRVLAFFALFFFAGGLGSPFWVPYILEDLGRSMSLLGVLGLLNGVAGLLTLPLWGRALDRFGAKPCLAIIAIISSVHPLMYVIATPGFVAPIFVDYISSGIVWGGWNLAILDLQLTAAPQGRGREMYFAAFAGATGLSVAAGSLLAGAVADALPGGRTSIFLLVSGLRLCSLLLLARLREPGARSLGELLLRARRTLFGV